MSGYKSGGEDFERIFFTEQELVDEYAGTRYYTCGDGYANGNGSFTDRSSPTGTVGGGNNWKTLVTNTGAVNGAGIKTDGTLWLWGANFSGQLGVGNTTNNGLSPVQIAGGGSWKVVCNHPFSFVAIKTDGTRWAWGQNFGELGLGNQISYSSPVQTAGGGTNWIDLFGAKGDGNTRVCASLKSDGSIWISGGGTNGVLGDGTTTFRTSPTSVAGGFSWKTMAIGGRELGAIRGSDNSLWVWGHNDVGQLADGTTVDKSSPINPANLSGTNWKSIAAGRRFFASIKTDGTLWVWGQNTNGKLGDGTTTDRSSPVQIAGGGTTWKKVNPGSTAAAAIKTDGTAWTWGLNSNGELGDGTTTNRSSPGSVISNNINWKDICMGPTNLLGLADTDY